MAMPSKRRIKGESDEHSESGSHSSLREGSEIGCDSSFNEESNSNDVQRWNELMIWIGKHKFLLAVFFSITSSIAVALLVRNFSSRCERANVENLMKTINEIKENFPSQDRSLWTNICSALETVSMCEFSCPRVVLMLDRGDSSSKDTSNCIASMVAEKSALLLPFPEKKPHWLGDNDLNCDGCISKQRELVKNHGIVIIKDLEKFPAKSASALHFFCDEHECDFGKSVYLLTMSVDNAERHPTKAAEMAFKALWQDEMGVENLDGLVARLTSQVVFVEPEKKSSCNA